MRVALWAVNLATPIKDLDEWISMVRNKVAEALSVRAEILIMPEYACMHWLFFKPREITARRELRWMSELTPKAEIAIQALALRNSLAILPGSWPAKKGAGVVNRAQLLLPDGRQLVQDKLHPIPTERDHDGWMVEPGEGFEVISWRGKRIAIMICHDVQSEELAKRVAYIGIDVILTSSMTEHEKGLMGHKAIFSAAKKHAEKYKRSVCAVGPIGNQRLSDRIEPNVGGAAVYKWRSTIAELGPLSNTVSKFGPIIIGNI